MGEQREAFHAGPPSLAQGMHFSPGQQSCAHRLHSYRDLPPPQPPKSGSAMKGLPVVSLPLESNPVVTTELVPVVGVVPWPVASVPAVASLVVVSSWGCGRTRGPQPSTSTRASGRRAPCMRA